MTPDSNEIPGEALRITSLPAPFRESIVRIFGERGRVWLENLPALIQQCRAHWNLLPGTVSPDLRMNYVEFNTAESGKDVALKIGVPQAELATEIEALRAFQGRGAVSLLDADAGLGAILMARLRPGTMLFRSGDDTEQTRIAGAIMRGLPAPVPPGHGFPAYDQWVEHAFCLTRTKWDPHEHLPRDLIDRAEEAWAAICRRPSTSVLLHGDLHHENILFDDEAGWTVIDPKGVIGPPCLEVGRFLHNQLPVRSPAAARAGMIRNRVDILCGLLPHPRWRIVASGLVDCVLSHCWDLEEGAPRAAWSAGIGHARALAEMLDEEAAG